jgi:hypothetical protein
MTQDENPRDQIDLLLQKLKECLTNLDISNEKAETKSQLKNSICIIRDGLLGISGLLSRMVNAIDYLLHSSENLTLETTFNMVSHKTMLDLLIEKKLFTQEEYLDLYKSLLKETINALKHPSQNTETSEPSS